MKIAAWAIGANGPVRANVSVVQLEKHLEDWIEQDPDLVSTGLRVVGRQVPVEGGRLDLLAVDPAGRWVLIEVKAGVLYRDVVTQAIDYVASLESLTNQRLRSIASDYLGRKGAAEVDAFLDRVLPESDEVSGDRGVSVIVVGTGRDPGLERLISYLSGRFSVPIRAVTFEVLDVGQGQQVLVREVTESVEIEPVTPAGTSIEAVFALAKQQGHGDELQVVYKAAVRNGLYPRPWKTCLMLAPPSQRGRALLTLWADGRFWTLATAFTEFYSISEDEVRAALGPDGWHNLTPDVASSIASGLDTLLQDSATAIAPIGVTVADKPAALVTIVSVLERADSAGSGEKLRVLIGAANQLGLPIRPFKTSLMFAPPANKTRALFTAWVDGSVGVWTEAFAQFFGLPEDLVATKLGPRGVRPMTLEQTNEFSAALTALIGGEASKGAPKG